MSNPKYKHVVIFVCLAVMVFGVAIASAYVRPKNPTMDYVPQNFGIYDTYYQNFKEGDCRSCHGASTADRHHETWTALNGLCLACHREFPVTVPTERDCKVCHIDGTTEVGKCSETNMPCDTAADNLYCPGASNVCVNPANWGFPHHRSDLADAGICIACHDPKLLVETNTVEPPQYVPTLITPTPYSCENCHWPNGATAHSAPPAADYNSWIGFPLPSHPNNAPPTRAPIEANGPMFSGILWGGGQNLQRPDTWLMAAKPFQPMDGTHHEVAGKVYTKCYDCHGTNPDTDPSWDPTNVYLIRMCENCHDINTLHTISEHVCDGGGPVSWKSGVAVCGDGITLGGGYAVNAALGTKVKANNKCVACHTDNLPVPPVVAINLADTPIMRPWFGPPGVTVEITPTNYVGPNYTLGEFGDEAPCSVVQMKNVGGTYFDIPSIWNTAIIRADVPGWIYTPGAALINIKTAADADCVPQAASIAKRNNAASQFTVMKGPEIDSLAGEVTNWGGTVTLTGDGYGTVREKVFAQEEVLFSGSTTLTPNDLVCDATETCTAYGYSTYVEIVSSNDRYRMTDYRIGTPWSPTSLDFKLINLWDVNAGYAVTDNGPELYVGDWQVYVITDIFKENPSTTCSACDGDHLNANGSIDASDQIIYRAVSNAGKITISKLPYINSLQPNPIPAKGTVKILGVNFGTSGKEINAAAGGDNDGVCEPNEKCSVAMCNPLHTVCAWVKVKTWTNTEIEFVAPNNLGTKAKKKDIMVILPGVNNVINSTPPLGGDDVGSNYQRLLISPRIP